MVMRHLPWLARAGLISLHMIRFDYQYWLAATDSCLRSGGAEHSRAHFNMWLCHEEAEEAWLRSASEYSSRTKLL